ncbi:ribose 5-phosphate isomerase B [Rapidithrix thailandica]|uniref:Ribose 5-phosphate isomerase B n=1 Tax=Rapidithrix thailandica TaxID=413964 RepID=A0AAW9S648_9BACT
MKIAIGGDHAGFHYKRDIIPFLNELGYDVKDFGPNSEDSVDYPDFAHPLSVAVAGSEFEYGILICGSGNGVAMTANKHPKVRAALCWQTELAELARSHNNANVLCIPSRFVELDLAKDMIKAFLKTGFEGGRHEKRVNKIHC